MGLIDEGKIVLSSGYDFEKALEDLIGFERIWIIYWLNRNAHWKPKVLTPRGGKKRGVFATRSPHRPNPIGLSCVELVDIKGLEIYIGKSDLLDATPILDIKPYLTYADSFPDCKQGWIEGESFHHGYAVHWSELSKLQAEFIEKRGQLDMINSVELRLTDNPLPFPNHRIKQLAVNEFELSLKTWRIYYSVEGNDVSIQHIGSGYDLDTLQGKKESRWDDVPLHIEFLKSFKTSVTNVFL